MKPRFEPRDEEFDVLLKRAREVEDRIAKRSSQPEYQSTEGSKVGPSMFVTETGGNTPVRSAHFSTNNSLIESEVVKNTGATSENSNVLGNTWSVNDVDRGVGSDAQPSAITKILGTGGEQLKLDTIAKSVERLSRHI